MKLLVFLLLPCLSLSKVVKDFGECKEFFLNEDPPKFTPLVVSPSVKYICQCLKDDSKPLNYFYATLYNTDWKIPIYSAYEFKKRPGVERHDYWYIEPQLDGHTGECMAAQYKKSIKNQAENDDYNNDKVESCYDRGHLYPVQHTYDEESMKATSTLTNSAPQDVCFNQRAWKKHETAVAKDLETCNKAYVVTGVVPDTNTKLNARVTVSKYYWSATCCLEKNGVYTGKGYLGPDNNKKVQELKIAGLQTWLAKEYVVDKIIIFPNRGYPTGGCN